VGVEAARLAHLVNFWLGIHHPDWLPILDVPSMVSYRRLSHRKGLPRAATAWIQDSGGFTELALHGGYQTTPRAYAERTRRHAQEVGKLEWAAIQDWMCEESMLSKTGLDVAEHQQRTVCSYLDLRELAPDLPWLPVLQGQVLDDYYRHADLYTDAGVDLHTVGLVGVGTVCRRQHTQVAVDLLQGLSTLGLPLHGFGLKVTGLLRLGSMLASADSMAWSIDGRYPKGGRCHPQRDHDKCANCLDYALLWRNRLVARL
jgi:hypothetical protein